MKKVSITDEKHKTIATIECIDGNCNFLFEHKGRKALIFWSFELWPDLRAIFDDAHREWLQRKQASESVINRENKVPEGAEG